MNHLKSKITWHEIELLNTLYIILNALKELHENNLVHGDLRMSNIVKNENDEVKLAD